MSQVDNKNSSAGKRARTDGGRREDDWTCPSCGNVNFSFRTTCNMRNCTQSRPADHSTKSAPKLLQAPPPYTSSAGYMGPGAPSSIYLSASPYGSSMFGGVTPYDRPFSGGSAYHYDYGSRLSVGSPYGPMHLSGPPHYSSGSMLGPGGMYGVPPMMDRYGLGLPMGPGTMGPRSGAFPEEGSQKGRENDWKCPNCGNNNFSFRTVCNMRKCNTPRPGSQGSKSENSKGSKSKMPDGSWKCEKCNNINYPFRTKCNRQNCGAEKPPELNKTSDEDDQAGLSEAKFRNLSKVAVFIDSWLLVHYINNSMPPPRQAAPLICECSQSLHSIDGKIFWGPRDFISAADLRAHEARATTTSNYWEHSFPSWISNLNVFDNTVVID